MPDELEELKKDLKILQEGQIKFYSYEPKDYSPRGTAMTKSMPVFYNPKMVINRDITLLAYRIFQGEIQQRRFKFNSNEPYKICDSMAASGIRALRLSQFLPGNVQILANDLNGLAIKVIQENQALNPGAAQLRLEKTDANLLFHQLDVKKEYQSVIDIDPFGTPNLFIESAIPALESGGLLSVTATDTPVLFGVRREACYRKYNARSLHSTFLKEVGIRILLYFISSRGHPMNYSIEPYLSFNAEHFIRVFVKFHRGEERVPEDLANIGYILWCKACDWRDSISYNLEKYRTTCPKCNQQLDFGGPLWLGPLHKIEFVQKMLVLLKETPKDVIPSRNRLLKYLDQIQYENQFPVGYYDIHKLCDILDASAISLEKLIAQIKQRGYDAKRTHFDPDSIKSNAEIGIIREILEEHKQLTNPAKERKKIVI